MIVHNINYQRVTKIKLFVTSEEDKLVQLAHQSCIVGNVGPLLLDSLWKEYSGQDVQTGHVSG